VTFHRHAQLACCAIRSLRARFAEAEEATPQLDHRFQHRRAAAPSAFDCHVPPPIVFQQPTLNEGLNISRTMIALTVRPRLRRRSQRIFATRTNSEWCSFRPLPNIRVSATVCRQWPGRDGPLSRCGGIRPGELLRPLLRRLARYHRRTFTAFLRQNTAPSPTRFVQIQREP